jgi:hypothetical protein
MQLASRVSKGIMQLGFEISWICYTILYGTYDYYYFLMQFFVATIIIILSKELF